MSTAAQDYSALVAKVQPRVIHDEAMNEQFIGMLDQLDRNWDNLTTNERAIHELLRALIEMYEREHYKLRKSTPIEAITELMEANGLKQKDLVGSVFETTSVASEVLRGKRSLTVDHIRRLCVRFGVSADLFI